MSATDSGLPEHDPMGYSASAHTGRCVGTGNRTHASVPFQDRTANLLPPPARVHSSRFKPRSNPAQMNLRDERDRGHLIEKAADAVRQAIKDGEASARRESNVANAAQELHRWITNQAAMGVSRPIDDKYLIAGVKATLDATGDPDEQSVLAKVLGWLQGTEEMPAEYRRS